MTAGKAREREQVSKMGRLMGAAIRCYISAANTKEKHEVVALCQSWYVFHSARTLTCHLQDLAYLCRITQHPAFITCTQPPEHVANV